MVVSAWRKQEKSPPPLPKMSTRIVINSRISKYRIMAELFCDAGSRSMAFDCFVSEMCDGPLRLIVVFFPDICDGLAVFVSLTSV